MIAMKMLRLGFWTKKVGLQGLDWHSINVPADLQTEQEKVITDIRVEDEELNEKFKVLRLLA